MELKTADFSRLFQIQSTSQKSIYISSILKDNETHLEFDFNPKPK